jgi:hypothetical protein
MCLLQMLLVCTYAGAYAFYVHRAFADHAPLPFARYRLSNTYIRLVVRNHCNAAGAINVVLCCCAARLLHLPLPPHPAVSPASHRPMLCMHWAMLGPTNYPSLPPAVHAAPPPAALQARHAVVAFLTVLFSIVVLTVVDFNSCWSYLDGSLGIAPVQARLCCLRVFGLPALSALTGRAPGQAGPNDAASRMQHRLNLRGGM